MKLLRLLILTLSLAAYLLAQTAEFTKVDGSGTGAAGGVAEWNFEIGANKYEIRENGRGQRTNSRNVSTNFLLPLGTDEMLKTLYFASHKNDLVFIYGAHLGGEGIGYISSFNSVTLRPKWKAVISGFNVGQGLIENQFAYLTAIGFIGKINLVTGKYVWKHTDLYSWNRSNGAFNSFEIPELEGSSVIFTEKTNDASINLIVVNKITGKIMRTVLGK